MLIFLGGFTIRLLLLSFSREAIDEITSGGFITKESSSLMAPSREEKKVLFVVVSS